MVQHLKPLTTLRGIAALMIVLHHALGYFLTPLGAEIAQHSHFFEQSYLWVDFFFILSGFVLAHVYGKRFVETVSGWGYREFIFARFARLYPLHIVILGGLVLLELLLSSTPFTGNQSLMGLFSNIFMLQGFDWQHPPFFNGWTYWNEPAWAISVEWLMYLVFPWVLLNGLRLKRSGAIATAIAAYLALIGVILISSGDLNCLGIPGMIRCLAEATLGILMYRYYQAYGQAFSQRIATLVMILAVIGAAIIMHTRAYDLMAIPCFSLLIVAAARLRTTQGIAPPLHSRLGLYLGTLSYGIYMVHWPIQVFTTALLRPYFATPLGTDWSMAAMVSFLMLYLLIVIGLAALAYHVIEAPCRTWLRQASWSPKMPKPSSSPS